MNDEDSHTMTSSLWSWTATSATGVHNPQIPRDLPLHGLDHGDLHLLLHRNFHDLVLALTSYSLGALKHLRQEIESMKPEARYDTSPKCIPGRKG